MSNHIEVSFFTAARHFPYQHLLYQATDVTTAKYTSFYYYCLSPIIRLCLVRVHPFYRRPFAPAVQNTYLHMFSVSLLVNATKWDNVQTFKTNYTFLERFSTWPWRCFTLSDFGVSHWLCKGSGDTNHNRQLVKYQAMSSVHAMYR